MFSLKIDICNLEKFIKINNLQEVTNSIRFDQGWYPTEDGLLSYKIFGQVGSYDRKTIFAYIDLKGHFLHPLFYQRLTRMNRNFTRVIDGSGYFSINAKGELVADNENGDTGIDWLYKNFKNLKFKKSGSGERDRTIDLLNKMDIDEIFVSKWLVIPAFYRDSNIQKLDHGKVSEDDINKMYANLINLASSNSDFDFMGYTTQSRLQKQLLEIYDYFNGYIKGKEGLLKNNLLGKTVDYSTRGVISAGRVNSNKPADQLVKFTYTGIPLSHLCNLFYPFFQYEIDNFARETFATVQEIRVSDGTYCKLVDPMSRFTTEKIKAMLNLYIKSPDNRLDPIMVPVIDKSGELIDVPLYLFQDELSRRFTLLDLVYIVAVRVCQDKHVYVTRFPIENYQSIYPSRIKIMTTYKTQKIEIGNRYYDEYPVITKDLESPVIDENINYIDTIIPHNTMLEALGADFDGDTVSLRSVYSQEANIECEKLINSSKYLLDVTGKTTRVLRNEGIQTLYTLTRDE